MKQKRTTNIISNIVAILLAVAMLFPILWIIVCSLSQTVKCSRNLCHFFQRTDCGSLYSRTDQEPCVPGLSQLLYRSHGCPDHRSGTWCYRSLRTCKIPHEREKAGADPVSGNTDASCISDADTNVSYIQQNWEFSTAISHRSFLLLQSVSVLRRNLKTVFPEPAKSLDDAARVDGCNALTSFLRVMLPIAKPGVITAAALSFIFGWNTWHSI